MIQSTGKESKTMNMKTCKHCNDIFDLDGHLKRLSGGKINECPSCVEELATETAVKYLGFASGAEGEATPLSIVSYDTNSARAAGSTNWRKAPDKA